MNLIEKQLTAEYIYEGKIIKVRRDTAILPDGKNALREVIEHPGGVCVVPVTDDRKIMMVEQYRYPYSEIIEE
ncbi:MAG: ADP-ribose pyrophosphatase, partial [Clostridia bacterium]|nr:ADP-ribose pyrophosphatase [Clostridia bacterium]